MLLAEVKPLLGMTERQVLNLKISDWKRHLKSIVNVRNFEPDREEKKRQAEEVLASLIARYDQVVEEERLVEEARIARDNAHEEANAEQFAIYRAEEMEARRIAREKAAAQAEIVKAKLAAKAAAEAERQAAITIPNDEVEG
jgi:hypothetical protein